MSERLVTKAELAHLVGWNLRIARNEIFARYGYRFGQKELVNHFGAQSWYQPTDVSVEKINAKLTRTEWRNIRLIRQSEQKLRKR